MTSTHHHNRAPRALRLGVITASDSRNAETDASGKLVQEMLRGAGHTIGYYEVIPDEPAAIAAALRARLPELDGIVINGGTGISPRDSTFEAVRSVLDKEVEGFGELFRMLSYQEIGSAAFLSRAMAGISAGKLVVSLPGAPAACRLGLEKLLIPQLSHIGELLGL